MIFSGRPYLRRILQMTSLSRESKAFRKSMKFRCNSSLNSVHCSIMFLSVKIWSMHPLFLLKPACSSLSFLSISFSILFSKILVKILLGIDNSVIPRQLSHVPRSPFFGILTIRPFCYWFGMFSEFHMFLMKSQSISAERSVLAWRSSACMEWTPGGLFFLSVFMVFFISSLLGSVFWVVFFYSG